MGAVKITSADRYFSLCVRERSDNKCERCGAHPAPGGLHCSHFHGRGKWGVRFDPDNATALCMGCHLYFTGQPAVHRLWARGRLGVYAFDALQERVNDRARGKIARKSAKEIAAHYRGVYAELRKRRDEGATGRLEFEGYL